MEHVKWSGQRMASNHNMIVMFLTAMWNMQISKHCFALQTPRSMPKFGNRCGSMEWNRILRWMPYTQEILVGRGILVDGIGLTNNWLTDWGKFFPPSIYTLSEIFLSLRVEWLRECCHSPSQVIRLFVGPPFKQDIFRGMRHRYRWFIRCILEPVRVNVIAIPTVGATVFHLSFHLFHRACIVVGSFPIPAPCAVFFIPHSLYPVIF